ncbi:ubiquitin-specific protease UBP11 [Saccharomyces paradoxus]|uniref:Ubiquitin carboxyl-terminal hydrolase n=1 Tax=Saccharomyces paradoxus TaxID=27291 RepID=A0A8B8UVH7_SACPA|nr:Ubp11 [Saccharomyces paradoxus]QHS74684.1 Ubp11 [Saccharomyces paradoxus]
MLLNPDQILNLVRNVYEVDIKQFYSQLRLKNLRGLLDHAAHLFNVYLRDLEINQEMEALTAFIIGCYYLYLIIPQSLQFQTRNNLYSSYAKLKNDYQDEQVMSHVLKLVRDESTVIADRHLSDSNGICKTIKRKRAYSLPLRPLPVHMASLSIHNQLEGPIHEMPKELTKPINDTSMGDITSESDKIASGDKLEADFEESDYRNKELVSKPSYLKLSTRKDALFKTLSSPATAPTMHSFEISSQIGESSQDSSSLFKVGKHKEDEEEEKEKKEDIKSSALKTYKLPVIEDSNDLLSELSITGLQNPCNTCYINSIIQCLFGTNLFRDLFLTKKYRLFLNTSKYPKEVQLSHSIYVLFKKMYLNGGRAIIPNRFLKMCKKLRPDLNIPDDQQDTQEFLLIILARIHEELSSENVIKYYPDLVSYDANALQVNPSKYRKWYERNVITDGLSPIDHIYRGQMENILKCQRCGNSSYSYSTFYVLSLAIPKISLYSFTSKSKKIKLEDCINLFTGDEELSGENAWDCPNCRITDSKPKTGENISQKKKPTLFSFHSRSRSKSPHHHHHHHHHHQSDDATKNSKKRNPKKLTTVKSLDFIVLPPILVIHLSRFYYDLTKKNSTIITYPLILNIILKNGKVVRYKLYGTVNHSGNLINGHYTSVVNKERSHEIGLNRQVWVTFDDDYIQQHNKNRNDFEAGKTEMSSSEVYVLFYERMDEGNYEEECC